MKSKFRRPAPGEQPTGGSLDELLADPPESVHHGALRGYDAGSRIRRGVYAVLIVGTIAAAFAGYRYIQTLHAQRKNPAPTYELSTASDNRPRPDIIVWSSGLARLGLSRTSPGVRAIVLPDRILTLAPHYDHAQVKVNVVDGQTVALHVLVGKIEQQPIDQ